ncbi:hypothetical protein [Umezawaea sp. Da 62-37]|uniref:hypothetical protein n=1 Tax=Umezawaea sp. Da 62-37 TaxID=3075927 RepID=UPI0028F6EAFA|nr:hypothetical protein [Umezawaea sp. Da 62-37]WNV90016.1 hypothetical protein RM788_17465 [Umezawaea sp. Da 62-37]
MIRFESDRLGGLHRYAYLPGEDLPLDDPWAGLFEEWSEDGVLMTRTPMTEYAVNNCNCEEVAVYLGLVWRLTEGRHRVALPTYYRDEAAALVGQEPTFVEWEYDVDAAVPDLAGRDKGFVPGRACVPFRPEPTAWQREHAAQAGLFDLREPSDLVAMLRATLGDATAEVTVFAVEDRERLVHALRTPTRPDLASVLAPGDVFVDLTIGVDEHYSDSIVVVSHDDLGARVAELTEDAERRIAGYDPAELADMPAFLDAMGGLSGLR